MNILGIKNGYRIFDIHFFYFKVFEINIPKFSTLIYSSVLLQIVL